MKRLLIALVLLAAALSVSLWQFPAARVALDVYPPARTAFESLLKSSGNATSTTAEKAPEKKGGRGGGAVPVTAALVKAVDMPVILTAPGTVEADATVGVRARVDGQVAEVMFKEGDAVRKDQVLFRLDDRLIRAQIRQAEANIARDKANLAEATATLDRRKTLVQKQIVAEAAMDTAKASVNALKAGIEAGEAMLEAQRTQLDYLTIKAPIAGRTGSSQVNPGSNVRAADATPLVVINQIDPISVAFALPQGEIGALRRAAAAGMPAEITIPGPRRETRSGRIAFIDNQVDKQTGTLTAKVEVANRDEALWPGLAVEVALTVAVRKGVLAVPAGAVLPAQQGMIVWVIDADNRVAPKSVTLDRIVGQTAYLNDGIKPGDQVVTDGHVRIAQGTAVSVRDPAAQPKGQNPATSKKEDAKGRPTDRRS